MNEDLSQYLALISLAQRVLPDFRSRLLNKLDREDFGESDYLIIASMSDQEVIDVGIAIRKLILTKGLAFAPSRPHSER